MKTAASKRADGSAELAKLRKRINAVRRKNHGVTLARGAMLIAGAAVCWLTAEMFLDWLIELPWIVRAVLLPVAILGLLCLVWRHLISPLLHRPNEEALALMVERAIPAFRTRFIASIQLARGQQAGTSPLLVHALLAETAAMAAHVDFRGVVNTGKLKHTLKVSAYVLAASAALLTLGGKADVPLFERAFLSRVALPRKTQIVSPTGKCTVGIGDDLKIEADAAGIVPSGGRVTIKYANGQTHDFTLDADPKNHAHFSRVIQSVQESFTYIVYLNDATSPSYQVTALPRPMVTAVDCELIYPAYTRLEPVHREVGDLTLLAGSQLKLKITTNSDIKQAAICSIGVDKETPLKIDEKDHRKLTGALAIPAKDLTGFSIALLNENGVATKGDVVYRVTLAPDHPPTIKITQPERTEELVTQQGSLVIGFEATDDFGVSKVELHYKASQDEPEKTVPFKIGDKQEKSITGEFEWKIQTLSPAPVEGASIEYWLEAIDTNNVTGPGVTDTEHYQLKVVSANDKRADLTNRFSDSIKDLKDIDDSQDDATKDLRPLILEKTGQQNNPVLPK